MKANRTDRARYNLARKVTILLGFVVMVTGLHSHIGSNWVKYKFYPRCDSEAYRDLVGADGLSCPKISMERYFISVIVICFIISLAIFCSPFCIDWRKSSFKIFNVIYHATSGVLLLVAGIAYIVATEQLRKLAGSSPMQLRWEKLFSGVLAIVEAEVYLAVAVLARKL